MAASPDWGALRVLLRDESRRVLEQFLVTHDKDELRGVGYVFELWNVTPQLDLCAHVSELADDPEERFNSGDYDFPAGLTGPGKARELGPKWCASLTELHTLAEEEAEARREGSVYRGLVALTGTVLLDLRAEGLVPDGVDLNVSEVGDNSEKVAARHEMLEAWKVPDAGKKWTRPEGARERGKKPEAKAKAKPKAKAKAKPKAKAKAKPKAKTKAKR